MIPTFEEFLYPFLLMLKDGELSNKEMKEKLVAYFNLTEDDLAQTTQGGNTTQWLIELVGVGNISEGHYSLIFLKGESGN